MSIPSTIIAHPVQLPPRSTVLGSGWQEHVPASELLGLLGTHDRGQVVGYLLLAFGAVLMVVQLATDVPQIPVQETPVICQHPQPDQRPALRVGEVNLDLCVLPELAH